MQNRNLKVENGTSASLEQNGMLADAFGCLPNFHEIFMNYMYRKVTAEWDTKLKTYIQENLKQFGYTFETDAEFFEFCKNRVHRIENKPNEWEIYLDYVDAENTGKLIGICSDKIDFKMDGNTATVTIGKSIGSRTSEVFTAADAIKELEAHADIFTCPKSILPEVFSIMDRDYTSGDFKYMVFGRTAHCKRTKKLSKRSA